jgi:hypothetical protein
LLRPPLLFADDLPLLDELLLPDELRFADEPPLRPNELFPLVFADERDRDDDEPPELRLPDELLLPLLADEERPPEDDEADFRPPLELELDLPPLVLLPDEVLPDELFPDELLPDELLPDELLPDDEREEPLLLPPPDLEPELPDEDELDLLRPEVDREPDDRPLLVDAADRLDGVIVSAAAPTAPTAAPVAAPVRISPATSITLSTIAVPVERLDLEELRFDEPEFFFDPDEVDLFVAMCFLPKMFVNKTNRIG